MRSPNVIVALVCLFFAACAASYLTGRSHEAQEQLEVRTALELEAFKQAQEVSEKLKKTEEELEKQKQLLEEAANADKSSSPHRFPVQRVRRLNLR